MASVNARLALLLVAALSACATPIPPSPNPNWTRVPGTEAHCVSYAPRKRERVDFNVMLKPEFESSLVAQMDPKLSELQRCWYETPTGSLRLFVGDFCGVGTDLFFEPGASGWSLARTNDIFATCHDTR